MEWQPIETAPKGFKLMLDVWVVYDGKPITAGRRTFAHWFIDKWADDWQRPFLPNEHLTHWFIPTPPSPTQKDNSDAG